MQIANIVATYLEIPVEKLGVVDTGDFVEILVQPRVPLENQDFIEEAFDSNTPENFRKCVLGLQIALRAHENLKQVVVSKVWKKEKLLTFPGSGATVIQSSLEPVEWGLWEMGMSGVEPGEALPPQTIQAYPVPDRNTVVEECLFLKERAKVKGLPFKERSAVLAVAVHLAGKASNESLDIAHGFAEKWDGYDPVKVGTELGQIVNYGPRTCANIDRVSGQNSVCRACPHWGKINSPITLKSSTYVESEANGFHLLSMDAKGNPKKIPDYEGLRRHFYNLNPYTTIHESEATYRWNGKTWDDVSEAEIRGFAQKKFKPLANNHMASEFTGIMKRTELKSHEWFTDSIDGKMNFGNGVLDIKTMEFSSHDQRNGFRKVLPYDYDPTATCPRFEKFLEEVTCERRELIDIILEYAGYSLSGDAIWEQKAIVLIGEGRNGKSKLVQVIKALAGEGASTSQTFVDLEKDTNRAALDGSLFNIAEETPSKSLMDSSLFKALIGGAEISVKKLYQQPYEIKNRAKFWMLCNDMPRSADKAYALTRRFAIVPFEAMFIGDADDKRIEEKLFKELPGILNLVLKSYKKMLERGGLPYSQVSEDKLNEYKEENDNVWRWFKECTEDLGDESEYAMKPKELYNSYQHFAEEEGEKATTSPSFFKRLSMLWKPYNRRKKHQRTSAHGSPERMVKGIKIKDEYRIRVVR